MVILGTDAHKRSHTVVAVDEARAEIDSMTVAATRQGHLRLVKWAARWEQRQWAIEDRGTLSRRLESDLPSTTSISCLGPIRQWWPPWDDVKSPGSES